MTQYSATGAATLLLGAEAPLLAQRVTMTLLKHAASLYAGAEGQRANYIRQVASNPYGVANSVLPTLVALVDVASPGTDQAPTPPSDAELAAAMTALWPFFAGETA